MCRSRIARLAVAAVFASSVYGQQSGWQQNQVNATMCIWEGLRAAQIQDTVYIDGGYLYWAPGLADESYGLPVQDGNPLGLIYTLNFSQPFNQSTNVSSIMNTISKASNGGAANNLAPNYYDGAMLANSFEFFLYGGLLTDNDAYSPPDANNVLEYEIEHYGTEKDSFRPGFLNDNLPDGLTRYITYGGAANAPSENMSWYFGGQRSPSWGPIYYPSANASLNPTNISNTLVTLDMSDQLQPKWTNVTIPDTIPSRANPSVVWVPVGEKGILVVLGGVVYPNYDNAAQVSQNEAQSEQMSPNFMSDINVYDIAGDKWYIQPTIGAPPQYAQGCAVVACAQDYSSYNIYYYGGYDGIHETQDFNDDVWVLSLPSFMWMKVSSGNSIHARAGQQCVKPYPDQMITVGGYTAKTGEATQCLSDGLLTVFNLTAAEWMDSYDPNVWSEYGVPEMIHLMIGGDYDGGATMTTPTPTGWATPALASVFASTYPASQLTTYYPYGTAGAVNNTRGGYSGGGGGGGTPSWVAPVLGVVLGLVFLTAVAVAILLYRRRRLLRKNGGAGAAGSGTEGANSENRNRIVSWMHGTSHGVPEKAATVTSEESPPIDMESRNITPMSQMGAGGAHYPGAPGAVTYEMAHTPLVELMGKSRYPQGPSFSSPSINTTSLPCPSPSSSSSSPSLFLPTFPHLLTRRTTNETTDTSAPVELGDTGLNYTAVMEKHSRHGGSTVHNSPHSPTNPSTSLTTGLTGVGSGGEASSISSYPSAVAPAALAATGGPMFRADSPPLGRGPSPSVTSSTAPGHLRDVSVTSTTAAGEDDAQAGGNGNGNGGHLKAVPQSSNPMRRSVFRESTEDLGDTER
ncbi:hypothetical protein GGR56DRAFT_690162 [Xylariaceae sp. FL0804]|nr:hypothetical protein GGR56DRAFT_690162 [Xylariaceae sp. FL0804]